MDLRGRRGGRVGVGGPVALAVCAEASSPTSDSASPVPGPLVGRYKGKAVEGDDYHLTLSRYVHLNPVRTQAAMKRPLTERLERLRTYRWSSYPAYVGKAKTPEWLTCGAILAFCGRKEAEQRDEYARFVEAGVVQKDEATAQLLRTSPFALQIQSLANRLAADRSLRRQLTAIEKELTD